VEKWPKQCMHMWINEFKKRRNKKSNGKCYLKPRQFQVESKVTGIVNVNRKVEASMHIFLHTSCWNRHSKESYEKMSMSEEEYQKGCQKML
jgi:hypothetical protein